MSAHTTPDPVRHCRERLAAADDSLDIRSLLEAGARARAVSEACEARGLAPVLLDRRGRVLHVSAAAALAMGGALRVVSDHILGADAQANAAIEAVLNPVLGDTAADPKAGPLQVFDVTADGSVVVAALSFADPGPSQLAKAILLVGRSAEDLRRGSAGFRV